MRLLLVFSTLLALPATAQTLRGQVMGDKKAPLPGAVVRWLGTTQAVVADSTGRFALSADAATGRIITSYVGYENDTLAVAEASVADTSAVLRITLRPSATLDEVTVTAGASTQLDRLNPIQTEVLTQRTLAKAACCNLSESFETNASVSVQFADAVTGARQIQFLGLGGQYVQTNVENIPTLRGLATTFGLNYIPGTWVTSIDLGKGVGSVVNGYEAMSGAMNVELQKPDSKDKLFLNTYANSFGRVEGNVNWSQKLKNGWSIGALGHVSTLRNELDQNRDGFRDLPLYTQFNGGLRAKWSNERWMTQFGVRALNEERQGGQLSRFGPQRYVFDNTTRRVEAFSKIARLYPEKPYRGLGLILNAVNHEQDVRFGPRPYTGRQQTLYANLIYQTIIDNTNHTVKTGASYLLDVYNERLDVRPFGRRESVPGVFAEYVYTPSEHFGLILGNRLDYHNLFGMQWTPRLHAKYHIHDVLTLRASAGRGWRTPNQVAENFGYLVSSRNVVLNPLVRPEISWSYGLSAAYDFLLAGMKAQFVTDYYRTDFQNQLVVDAEHPGNLHFYNTKGPAFANSFQVELNVVPVRRAEVKLAYRLFDVKQTYGEVEGRTALLPRMMIPRDRVLLNAGYALPFDRWKWDATVQWNGPRRLNLRPDDPWYSLHGPKHRVYQGMPSDFSPGFFTLNAQVSKAFRSGLEVYLGGENLTGFRQRDPILSPDQPFGPTFDAASRAWGPITGAMVYVGARFKIQEP